MIAFADDKINLNQKLKFDMGRVENIVGKGENAGYQHFLLFPQCFQMAFFSRSFKGLHGKGLTVSQMTNFRLFQTERVCRRQFQI